MLELEMKLENVVGFATNKTVFVKDAPGHFLAFRDGQTGNPVGYSPRLETVGDFLREWVWFETFAEVFEDKYELYHYLREAMPTTQIRGFGIWT